MRLNPIHVVAYFMLLVEPTFATNIPPPDVPDLVYRATLIVTGKITTEEDSSGLAVPRIKFGIEVDRVLKGELRGPRKQISVEAKSVGIMSRARPKLFGMYFLTIDPDGKIKFLSNAFPGIIASPSAVEEVGVGDQARDILTTAAYEVASVFALPEQRAGNVSLGVARDVRLVGTSVEDKIGRVSAWRRAPSRRDIAETAYQEASISLHSFPVDTQLQVLRALIQASDRGIGFAWASGELVRSGDLSQLPTVVSFLLDSSHDYTLADYYLSRDIAWIKPDPRELREVLPLLQAKNLAVRDAAAVAVSQVDLRDIIPPLEALLEDSDEQIRNHAVQGICRQIRMCNGLNVTTMTSQKGVAELKLKVAAWMIRNP